MFLYHTAGTVAHICYIFIHVLRFWHSRHDAQELQCPFKNEESVLHKLFGRLSIYKFLFVAFRSANLKFLICLESSSSSLSYYMGYLDDHLAHSKAYT